MAALSVEELRAIIAKRTAAFIDQHQNRPGFKAPPPQLIEAMIDTETGGTLDPGFVDPVSGALGLGNITTDGYEWGIYKASHPDAKESDLLKPDVNIDVMIEGLSARQDEGMQTRDMGGLGSYADWYMAGAGYLGGANEAGFSDAIDGYGTSGAEYVRRLRLYINRIWGPETAKQIDLLQPGAAVATDDDWVNGEITYDPDAPTGSTDYFGALLDSFKNGLSDAYNGVRDKASDVAGQVLGGLLSAVGAALPRVGLAVGGLALAVIGLLVLFRSPIGAAAAAKGAE